MRFADSCCTLVTALDNLAARLTDEGSEWGDLDLSAILHAQIQPITKSTKVYMTIIRHALTGMKVFESASRCFRTLTSHLPCRQDRLRLTLCASWDASGPKSGCRQRSEYIRSKPSYNQIELPVHYGMLICWITLQDEEYRMLVTFKQNDAMLSIITST